jgi:hypothetical protein
VSLVRYRRFPGVHHRLRPARSVRSHGPRGRVPASQQPCVQPGQGPFRGTSRGREPASIELRAGHDRPGHHGARARRHRHGRPRGVWAGRIASQPAPAANPVRRAPSNRSAARRRAYRRRAQHLGPSPVQRLVRARTHAGPVDHQEAPGTGAPGADRLRPGSDGQCGGATVRLYQYRALRPPFPGCLRNIPTGMARE